MKPVVTTLVSSFLAVLCLGAAAAADSESTDAVVTACERLVIDYARARDTLNREDYVNAFTADGVLVLAGQHLEGHEAIRDRAASWSEDYVTRHLMTTIAITPVDDTTATGVSYVLIIGEDREDGAAEPLSVTGFRLMGEYHDEFRLTDDGWKISRRELKPTFVRAASE